MRVYYDREADTNLIKDAAGAWQFRYRAVLCYCRGRNLGGWLVMTRVGVNTTLTAFDLTALRSGLPA